MSALPPLFKSGRWANVPADQVALAVAERALDALYTPETSAAIDRALVAVERSGATSATSRADAAHLLREFDASIEVA